MSKKDGSIDGSKSSPSTNSLEIVNNDISTLPTSPTSTSASLIDSLKNNQFFGAGFGLIVLGAGMSILKKTTSLAYTIAQKKLTVSLEVVSYDKSYVWLLKWIDMHLSDKSQHISVLTSYSRADDNSTRINTSFSFAPSIGIHYFNYQNKWIKAERVRDQAVDRNTGSPVETLKLTTLGTQTKVFTNMLSAARQYSLQQQVGKTLIYHAGLGS
jgi:mitochondrial chaperone BCS1